MKKKMLLGVLVATLVLAVLVGCVSQGAVESATFTGWNGITSTAASKEDTAKFKLTKDAECDACHADEMESTTNENCLAGDPEHAELVCTDCHVNDRTLVKAHSRIDANSKPKDELKKTTVSSETCLVCHDYSTLIANTPVEAFLTDANGTTVNPHEAPGLTAGHSNMTCVDCHPTHTEAAPSEKANAMCLSCHHANVYECGTCH